MKIHDKFIDKLDFVKRNGLIPVVVQDIKTKDILMLAYANRNAIENTVKTGNAWFSFYHASYVRLLFLFYFQKVIQWFQYCL
jgi:phosphoribosyl-AMP cyclohydrolase